MKCIGARGPEILVEVTPLQQKRAAHDEESLDEAGALEAVAVEAALSHEDREASRTLGGIVGGPDAVEVDEGRNEVAQSSYTGRSMGRRIDGYESLSVQT